MSGKLQKTEPDLVKTPEKVTNDEGKKAVEQLASAGFMPESTDVKPKESAEIKLGFEK